ncbi:MAG: hypothetical protein JXA09_17955, partial [Anaerolineae bacterium]|nr:hypothetical protein [Anaerolineae bacterium]
PAEQTPAERTLAEPAPARETAFDRTQKILDSLAQRRQARAAPAAEAPAGAEPQALTVDRDEFEQLSADVLRLRDEIGALQREIAALSALARGAGAPVDGALDDDLPVEEVA